MQKNIKLFLTFSLIILSSLVILSLVIPVHASLYTGNPKANSNGYVLGSDSGGEDYGLAHTTAVASYNTTQDYQLGQRYVSATTTNNVWRAFLKFDTSSVSGTINSAKLCLKGTNDYSTTDFIIKLQKWTGDAPCDTDDYNSFDGTNYDNNGFSTSSWVLESYNNITISDTTLIVKGGNTLICIRSSRDVLSSEPSGLEYINFYSEISASPPILEVNYTSNNAPTIGAVSGTNWDDTDNLYAQKKSYKCAVTFTDTDGYADIHHVDLYLQSSGNTTRAQFQYHEDDNSVATISGSTEWTFDSAAADFVRSGTTIVASFNFTAQWDATEESDCNFLLYVVDAAGAEASSVSTQNFDVVTRLVTSGFTSDDSRINKGGTTTISGTVYYANNPASNTASSSYPPDAEFTSVSIHDSAHAVQATDSTIVNGAFSVSFAIPNAVQSNTYHVYINLADADGTDQDALDGDTTAVIGDSVTITITVSDNRININANASVAVSGIYDYDSSAFDGTFSYNYSTWQQATVQRQNFTVSSLSGGTYGITTISTNDADYIIWDSLSISITVADNRIDVNINASVSVSGTYLYDSTAFDGSFTYNYSTWSQATAQRQNFTVSSVSGGTYGITSITTNDADYIIWDSLTISITGPSAQRINIGSNCSGISVSAVYDYDGTAFGGTFTMNDTTYIHATVGRWNFSVASVSGDSYGITAIKTNDDTYCVWDALTIWNLQTVQYKGSGQLYYQAQLKYSYDGAIISGMEANISTFANALSNSSGWVVFTLSQSVLAAGTWDVYGISDHSVYGITAAGTNQTITLLAWTINTKDQSSNTVTTTTLTVTNGSTTVWLSSWSSGDSMKLPADYFNASFTWQSISVNSTLNYQLNTNATVNFSLLMYPYAKDGTNYEVASDATISSVSISGDVVTATFSGSVSTYTLKCAIPSGQKPVYIYNCTYDIDTAWISGMLTLTHYANTTIKFSLANWGGTYIQSSNQRVTSASWVSETLFLTFTGDSGSVGTLELYCGSRGNPATTVNFSTSTFSSSLSMFTGSYSFASDKTVTMTWNPSSGTPAGPGGNNNPIITALVTCDFILPVNSSYAGGTINGTLHVEWTGPAVLYVYDIRFRNATEGSWFAIDGLPFKLVKARNAVNGEADFPIQLRLPKNATEGRYVMDVDIIFRTEASQDLYVNGVVEFSIFGMPSTVPDYMVMVFIGVFALMFLFALVRTGKVSRHKKGTI